MSCKHHKIIHTKDGDKYGYNPDTKHIYECHEGWLGESYTHTGRRAGSVDDAVTMVKDLSSSSVSSVRNSRK